MRSTIVAILFVVALCLGFAGCSDPKPSSESEEADPDVTQETVPSGADAFVDPGAPDENFGDAASGTVRGDAHYLVYMSQSTLHGFRRAPLEEAVLTIPLERPVSGDLAGATVELRPLLRPWSEKLVTWNCSGHYRLSTQTRECRDSWKGGQRAWGLPTATVTLEGGETELVFPIAKDLQNFLHRGVRNHGWMVRLDRDHEEGITILARESGSKANMNLRLRTVKAAQVTVDVSADTEVSMPHTNFGTAETARVFGERYRMALSVDTNAIKSQIPSGEIVDLATLHVNFVGTVPAGNDGKILELRRLLVPWEELNATGFCANDSDPSAGSWSDSDCVVDDRWNNGNSPWSPPSAAAELDQGASGATFIVTEELGSWLRGDFMNYGWIITTPEGTNGVTRIVEIRTREYDPCGGREGQEAICAPEAEFGRPELVIATVPGPDLDPPPDPGTVAPNLTLRKPSTRWELWSFLFEGNPAIQKEVDAGAITPKKIALVRGRVLNRIGEPVVGALVRIAGHTEFGTTKTRADGWFDFAFEGGERRVFEISTYDRSPVARSVNVPWNGEVVIDDIVMVGNDPARTDLQNNYSEIQVAEATPSQDSDGLRQQVLLIQPNTTASMEVPGMGTVPLPTTFTLRSTEYTVGAEGPATMPADLPNNTGYTYAVNFSVDQAEAQHATTVLFDKPVIAYNEEFLGFGVGRVVPTGIYDAENGRWESSDNGRVVEVVDGPALTVRPEGTAATQADLDELGITPEELSVVFARYPVGTRLWRVQIPHFSPADCNWGIIPAQPYIPPPEEAPREQTPLDDPDCESGSIIECQNQVLGERIPIVGTPFSLNYRSSRVPGAPGYRIKVPLIGEAGLSPTLKQILVKVTVGGAQVGAAFTPQQAAASPVATIAWHGNDVYGRRLQGAQPANVCVGYVYPAVRVDMGDPATYQKSFGQFGVGAVRAGAEDRSDFYFWKCHRRSVVGGNTSPQEGANSHFLQMGTLDAKESTAALGGWTLSHHHFLSTMGGTLYFGDGNRRNGATDAGRIETFAGDAPVGSPMYGVDRTEARFLPDTLATGPDGSVYVSVSTNQILRINPDGFVEHFAGIPTTTTGEFSGDGGPAVDAGLGTILAMTVAPDGSLYFADWANWRVRRIHDGIVDTVAGQGFAGTSSPPFPNATDLATSQYIPRPNDVDMLPTGDLLIQAGSGTASKFLMRLDTQKWTIGHVAAQPRAPWITSDINVSIEGGTGAVGDGIGYAAQYLRVPQTGKRMVAVVGDDLYIGDDNLSRVLKLSMRTEVVASGVNLSGGGSIAASPSGTVVMYVNDGGFSGGQQYDDHPNAIWTLDGRRVAGGGDDADSEEIPAEDAEIRFFQDMVFGADGSLYIAEHTSAPSYGRIRRVSTPNLSAEGGQIAIPREDRSVVDIFDDRGVHIETRDALTGITLWTFAYDGSERLNSITDRDGAVTSIARSGSTITITPPDAALVTTLTLDAQGYVSAIENPAGEAHGFTYDSNGLMQSMTTPENQTHNFYYDADGFLTDDEAPENVAKHLARTEGAQEHTVTITTDTGTGPGYQSTYKVERFGDNREVRTMTAHDGSERKHTRFGNEDWEIEYPYETVVSGDTSRDPEWAMYAPVPTIQTETLSGQLTRTVYKSRDFVNGDNFRERTSVNDDTFSAPYVDLYDPSTNVRSWTTPEGRTTLATLDTKGRPTSIQIGDLVPVGFSYDARGRVDGTSQTDGTVTRSLDITYDANGFVNTVTDALSRVTDYDFDLAGRLVKKKLPDLREIDFAYDDNGNLESVTPPSRPSHGFRYDGVDRVEFYDPPTVAGVSQPSTIYDYNGAHQVELITRPDGQDIDLVWNPTTGRLDTIVTPDRNYVFAYDGNGRLSSISPTDAVAVSYSSYLGPMPRTETFTGEVSGSVSRDYDDHFRVDTESVNGGHTISVLYDGDGRATNVGAETLLRDPETGLVTDVTLGDVHSATGYNDFGEPESLSYDYQSTPLYDVSYHRNEVGQIIAKIETIGASTQTRCYGYDLAGRLLTVHDGFNPGTGTCTGTLVEQYAYDGNSNRSYALNSSGVVNGIDIVVDNQDRLVEYGDFLFTYSDNGELETKQNTATSDIWSYEYDVMGNLVRVDLPNGDLVEYVIDGRNRRVGKKVNGNLVQGLLYGDQLNPVAELDGTGAVVARFVYGSRGHVPDYMVKGGTTYRIVSDYLGSVVAVVDIGTGTIAQQIEYDAWGRVLSDTNPGFQPFGFAGGIWDAEISMLRFGARDYDPETGRWAARDPVLFAGGSTNLFGYSLADPINLLDLTGLAPGDPFFDPDSAAEDAAQWFLDGHYLDEIDEWGTTIYRRDDGLYSYLPPNVGDQDGWFPRRPDECPGDEAAHLHTHTLGGWFTERDGKTADFLNLPWYMLRDTTEGYELTKRLPRTPKNKRYETLWP